MVKGCLKERLVQDIIGSFCHRIRNTKALWLIRMAFLYFHQYCESKPM